MFENGRRISVTQLSTNPKSTTINFYTLDSLIDFIYFNFIKFTLIFFYFTLFVYLFIFYFFHIAVGVTSTVSAFSRGILNTVSDGFAGIINRGSDQRNTKNRSYKTYSYNQKNKNNNNNNNNQKNKKSGAFFKLSNLGFNFKKQNIPYRGQNINPWKPFWHFMLLDKKQEKKRIPWFSTVNFNSQNIGNKISSD